MNKADKTALNHLLITGALDEIIAGIHITYYTQWTESADLAERELIHARACALMDLRKQFKRAENAD